MNEDPASLWLEYTNRLFRKGVPMPFKDKLKQKLYGNYPGGFYLRKATNPIGR